MYLNAPDAKIYIAGHRGLVGSAVMRRLHADGYDNLLLRSSTELDLRRQAEVDAFFDRERPEYVILAAARVGGILANDSFPADFIGDNLAIQANVIRAAHRVGVRRLIFLGSSCIYPKMAPQPIREEYLLTGPLEPTNEWYAIAKIAGVKLCEAYRRQFDDDFITLMPANLYGPGDNFDLASGHVLAALLRKFHEARTSGASSVTVWGSGTPRREFLHVDDLADAILFVLRLPSDRLYGMAPDGILNVGVGEDLSVCQLAAFIRSIVGVSSEIVYDRSRPDGTPRKLLDIGRLRSLGWSARIDLEDGIRRTYDWYQEHETEVVASALP